MEIVITEPNKQEKVLCAYMRVPFEWFEKLDKGELKETIAGNGGAFETAVDVMWEEYEKIKNNGNNSN